MEDPAVAAEVDEMWSFVQSKAQQRWLWWAVNHEMGEVLVYVLSSHEDDALLQLKALLDLSSTRMVEVHTKGTYLLRYILLENAILRRLSESI
jgi:IS1 family transposase